MKEVTERYYTADIPSSIYLSKPAYEAEAGGSFIMFCMDKEHPTEWTATSENFTPQVRLISDLSPNMRRDSETVHTGKKRMVGMLLHEIYSCLTGLPGAA